MRTKQDVTIKFRDYGEITIPKGTKTTNQTACGINNKYNFVNEFDWIKTKYPKIDRFLRHDAIFYGINIPAEFIQHDEI